MTKKYLNRGAAGIAIIFLLSIILPAGQAAAHDRHNGDEYIDIIVRYKEAVPAEETLDESFENIQTMDLLPIQTMSVPASAIKDLSLNDTVKRITYDQEVGTSESDYMVSSEDWNQDMIGTFDAWEEGYTGNNINVAVLDTGFYQHPEITYAGGHSIFDEEYELGPDEWTNDHSGHGTHVAGILGAHQGTRAQGVAPGIDLYGVKVYHEDNGAKTRVGNLLSGLDWAIKNNSDIIVISSGYPDHNEEIHEMIQLANSQGILTVAASGNITDDNGTIDYPAAHEEVIAVSGVNQRMAHVSDSMVAYENELAAPGQNILSLSTDGTHSSMSGTSQATPHVAGIAALLMEKYPDESSAVIRQRMVDQALDLGDEGRDVIYGHGLVQFSEAAPEVKEPVDDESDPAEEVPEEQPDSSDGEEDSDEPEPDPDPETIPDDETESEQPEIPQEENTESEEPSSETIDNSEDNTSEEPAESEEETITEVPSENEGTEEEPEEDTASDEADHEHHSTIWIRPSETNGVATVAEEDIKAVPSNGVLAISFDSSLGHIDRIRLSREQVKDLKDKNITLLVARVDLEWVIPAKSLSDGNAFITFEPSDQELSYKEITKGKILSFGIEQEGERLTAFPSEMIYRFFTPAAEYNQDALYEWNGSEESWELLGDAYTNGGVVGVTSDLATLAVFNPDELEAAIAADEEENAEVVEESEETEPEPTNESSEEEKDSAFLEEDSSELPVVLSSVVVVLLSVTGGLYFFGGKSKS